MARDPMPVLLPISKVIEQARLHPLAVMPKYTHQSFPIPVRGGRRGLQMYFLYCPAKIEDPQKGLSLWSPKYLAILDAYTGQMNEIRKISTGELGPRHSSDQHLGYCRTPGQAMEDEHLLKLANWYQAFDIISPLFVARSYGLTAEEQEVARKLTKLNADLFEPPLNIYYQAVGREYYDWLQLVTPS